MFKVKWKYILIFSLVFLQVESKCDYKPCGPDEHTMCKYPAKLDKTKEKCSGKESIAGLKQSYRRAILDKHNELRQKVAQGKAEGQPPAANMMKLHWNTELEEIAQRFDNSCPGVAHDNCRNMKDGTPVGQNAGNNFFKYKENPNKTKTCEGPVEGWFSEIKDMSPDFVDDFSKADYTKVGHYTQLVWAVTDRLGCGYVEENYYDQTFQYIVLTCNYAVTGNMANQGTPIYIKGEACTKCPEGTHCSKRYPGLCTKEKNEYEDVPGEKKGKGGKGVSSRVGASWIVLPMVLAWQKCVL